MSRDCCAESEPGRPKDRSPRRITVRNRVVVIQSPGTGRKRSGPDLRPVPGLGRITNLSHTACAVGYYLLPRSGATPRRVNGPGCLIVLIHCGHGPEFQFATAINPCPPVVP